MLRIPSPSPNTAAVRLTGSPDMGTGPVPALNCYCLLGRLLAGGLYSEYVAICGVGEMDPFVYHARPIDRNF